MSTSPFRKRPCGSRFGCAFEERRRPCPARARACPLVELSCASRRSSAGKPPTPRCTAAADTPRARGEPRPSSGDAVQASCYNLAESNKKTILTRLPRLVTVCPATESALQIHNTARRGLASAATARKAGASGSCLRPDGVRLLFTSATRARSPRSTWWRGGCGRSGYEVTVRPQHHRHRRQDHRIARERRRPMSARAGA